MTSNAKKVEIIEYFRARDFLEIQYILTPNGIETAIIVSLV